MNEQGYFITMSAMSQSLPSLICFPGFLGVPGDFESFRNITPDLSIVDVCGADAPVAGQDWENWEDALVKKLRYQYEGKKVVLVGYSMGARIVLNIIRKNHNWIKAVALLSCHPGLTNIDERFQRAKTDRIWAERIIYEPWEDFLNSWNQQPALQDSRPLELHKNQFNQSTLARVIEIFSLSKQQAFSAHVIEIDALISWGHRDEKFKNLAPLLKNQFKSVISCEVPDSGHRILQDNPGYMLEKLKSFILSL